MKTLDKNATSAYHSGSCGNTIPADDALTALSQGVDISHLPDDPVRVHIPVGITAARFFHGQGFLTRRRDSYDDQYRDFSVLKHNTSREGWVRRLFGFGLSDAQRCLHVVILRCMTSWEEEKKYSIKLDVFGYDNLERVKTFASQLHPLTGMSVSVELSSNWAVYSD